MVSLICLIESLVDRLLHTNRARLCNVRFTSVKANLKFDEVTVNSKTGDFNPTSLAHVINTPTINELVVQTWLDRAGYNTLSFELLIPLSDIFTHQAPESRHWFFAST